MAFQLTHSFSKQIHGLRGPMNTYSAALRSRSSHFNRLHTTALSIRPKPTSAHHFWRTTGVVGIATVGLSLATLSRPSVKCDTTQATNDAPQQTSSKGSASPKGSDDLPPPPQSSVSLYELSFGTVCGICAGVFIKKGIKAVAFLLGGTFVLLQYLGSGSLVRVDWGRLSTRFENLFYTTDAQGVRRAPSVVSLWRWMVDFLTADFQPRASFIAGLALGLRIG